MPVVLLVCSSSSTSLSPSSSRFSRFKSKHITHLLHLHTYKHFCNDVQQILSVKKVGTPEQDRWRAIISDGQCFIQAMFATALNPKISADEVQRNSVVKLNAYTVNAVKDKT